MAISTTERDQILGLVVGLFNGAPGGANLSDLANALEAGVPIEEIADILDSIPLFTQDIMGGKVTVAQQVAVLMNNFGLTADGVEGSPATQAEEFFTSSIEAGMGFGATVLIAVNFLMDPNVPEEFAETAALLNNKVLVAGVHAENNNISSVAQAQAILFGVTDAGPSTEAEAIAFLAAGGFIPGENPGQTFTLTANADGPGAPAPATDTTGTAGNDIYNAVDTTLNSADTLDGKGGVDTLNVRATAAANAAPQLISIENINVSNVSNALYTLNLASATGAQVVASKDQVAAATTELTNIAATGVAARLDNADGRTDFNFLGAAGRAGTSDAVSIQIANGSGSATTPAVLNITDGAGVADATFENVNIATSGEASVVTSNLGLANVSEINVTGNAAADTGGYGLTLTAAGNFANARTIDASGMTGTGGLNIDARGATFASLAFTGSAQADRVALTGATLNAANTVALDGGDGDDTLAVTGTNNFVSAVTLRTTINTQATGFEVLEATANNVTALKANDFTGIDTFSFSGTQGGVVPLAITGVETGDKFVFSAASTGALDSDVVTLAGAVAGQSTTVELVASAANAASLVAFNLAGIGNALSFTDGLTSVTINSIGSNVAANSIQSTTGVAAIDNASASSVVITGSQALHIGAAPGVDNPLGFTQAVTVDASELNNGLRVAGSASADQIIGGNNADLIYGRGGNDVLTGNGGADQFRLFDALDGTDSITDFTVGTDKVGINTNFVNFAGTTATQDGATLVAADYVDTRNDITGIVAGDASKVIELQTSLTTAQITSQLTGGAVANAFVLVHNSTTGEGELWFDTDWNDAGARVQLVAFDNVVELTGVQSFTNADFVEYVV